MAGDHCRYAPAKPDFYGKGAALPLQRPARCVTPGKLQQSRRKIHTEGWPFIEHSGEAVAGVAGDDAEVCS